MSDSESQDAPSPLSLIDVLLMGFGLFLCWMAWNSFQMGDTLGAAADLMLGLAGVLLGARNPLQHSLQRQLPLLNTAAIVAVVAGVGLFIATFFQ